MARKGTPTPSCTGNLTPPLSSCPILSSLIRGLAWEPLLRLFQEPLPISGRIYCVLSFSFPHFQLPRGHFLLPHCGNLTSSNRNPIIKKLSKTVRLEEAGNGSGHTLHLQDFSGSLAGSFLALCARDRRPL